MNDEVWKDFFDDTQTRRVMDSSEVWRNYSQAELAREQLQKANAVTAALDHENQVMADIDAFRQKVASNPALKAYLKKAAEIRNDLRCDILEDIAFSKALAGDPTLIWKLLCSFGKSRGYGDVQKVDMTHTIPSHVSDLLSSLKDLRKNVISETTVCPTAGSKEDEHSGGSSEVGKDLHSEHPIPRADVYCAV